MAITKDVMIESIGVPVVGAYIRIENMCLKKDNLCFTLEIYSSLEFKSAKSILYTAPYVLEGENPFKQAYLYLKTLPEFQDAIDC